MSQQKRQLENDDKSDMDREQKRQKLDDIGKELTDFNEEYNKIEQELINNLQNKLKIEYEQTLTTNSQQAFNQPNILQSISSFLPFGQRNQFFYLTNRVNHLLRQRTKWKEDEEFDLSYGTLYSREDNTRKLGKFFNLHPEIAQNVVIYRTELFQYAHPPAYKLTEEDEKVKDDALRASRLMIDVPDAKDPDRRRQVDLLDFNRSDRRDNDEFPNPVWFMDEVDVKKWETDRNFLQSWRSAFQPREVIESMTALERLEISLMAENQPDSRTVMFGRAQTISELEEQKHRRSYYYRERTIPRLKLDYNPIVIVGNKPLEVKRMIPMIEISKLMQYTSKLEYTVLTLNDLTSPGYILEWEFDLPPSVKELIISLDDEIYEDYDENIGERRPSNPWEIHQLPYPEIKALDWHEYPRYQTVVLPRQKTNNIWQNITKLCFYGGTVPSSGSEQVLGWREVLEYLLSNVPQLEHLEITDNKASDRVSQVLFELYDKQIEYPNISSVSIKAPQINLNLPSLIFKHTRSLKLVMQNNRLIIYSETPIMHNLTQLQVVVTSDRYYRQCFNEVLEFFKKYIERYTPVLKLLRFAIVYKREIDLSDRKTTLQTISVPQRVLSSQQISGFETSSAEAAGFYDVDEFNPDGNEDSNDDDHECNFGLTFGHPLWDIYPLNSTSMQD